MIKTSSAFCATCAEHRNRSLSHSFIHLATVMQQSHKLRHCLNSASPLFLLLLDPPCAPCHISSTKNIFLRAFINCPPLKRDVIFACNLKWIKLLSLLCVTSKILHFYLIVVKLIYKLPTSLNRFNFSGNGSLNKTGSARYSTLFNGIVP